MARSRNVAQHCFVGVQKVVFNVAESVRIFGRFKGTDSRYLRAAPCTERSTAVGLWIRMLTV